MTLEPASKGSSILGLQRQGGRTMTIQQQAPLSVSHVDIAELAETFADSVSNVVWDGQTLRVDLSVTRYPPPDQMSSGAKRYPVCRLVLTPPPPPTSTIDCASLPPRSPRAPKLAKRRFEANEPIGRGGEAGCIARSATHRRTTHRDAIALRKCSCSDDSATLGFEAGRKRMRSWRQIEPRPLFSVNLEAPL